MSKFKKIFKGKVAFIGIGNVMKSDDAAGPLLVKKLNQKTNALCIDAGTTPENYVMKITKQNPDTILLIDAVDLGKTPGEYEILEKKDILNSGFTTHDMSPKLVIDFLEKESNAKIFMLAIQPENVKLGFDMSCEVKSIIDSLVDKISASDV